MLCSFCGLISTHCFIYLSVLSISTLVAEMENRGLGDKVTGRTPRTQLCPESVVHLKDHQCEGDSSCRTRHPSRLFLLSTSVRDSEGVETCPSNLQVSQLREPFRCSVPESEIKINLGVRLMAEIRLKHKSQTLLFQTHDQPCDSGGGTGCADCCHKERWEVS